MYKSYYFDSDIEMYYLNSRFYHTSLRRFITADDINYLDKLDISKLNLFIAIMIQYGDMIQMDIGIIKSFLIKLEYGFQKLLVPLFLLQKKSVKMLKTIFL